MCPFMTDSLLRSGRGTQWSYKTLMLWRIPATSPQQQLFLAEVIREVQFVVWTSVSTQVTTHNYITSVWRRACLGLTKSQGPKLCKICENWFTSGKSEEYEVANWKWRQAITKMANAVHVSCSFQWDGMEVKADACNLTAETNMEHESERNPVEKIRKMQVANRRGTSGKLEEGRKTALQPHPVHFCEFGQWESASSRVEQANSVRSCQLSMKIFATIGHWRKIPRVQALRSPNSQPCELGNLTNSYYTYKCQADYTLFLLASWSSSSEGREARF